jgi:hypothetical protein
VIPEAAVEENGRMTERDWTDEPTNEYAMRFAANRIAEYARNHPELAADEDEHDAINGAYQQLLRAANMIRPTK